MGQMVIKSLNMKDTEYFLETHMERGFVIFRGIAYAIFFSTWDLIAQATKVWNLYGYFQNKTDNFSYKQ